MVAGRKPTNPKDIIGSSKLPLHLWPATASAMGCLGFLDGALKYGRSNFRAVGVKASIYVDAAKRHLDAWFEGEDLDPDSGLPHLSHTLACCAILAEALANKNLTDDRMYPTRYREFVNELTEHVGRLKLLRKDCDPKHYTIADVRKPVVLRLRLSMSLWGSSFEAARSSFNGARLKTRTSLATRSALAAESSPARRTRRL